MSDDHFMLHEKLKSSELRIQGLEQIIEMFKAERDAAQKDVQDLTSIVFEMHKILNLTISKYAQDGDTDYMVRTLCYMGIALQKQRML